MSDIREEAIAAFQQYLDALGEPFGFGVCVTPLQGGGRMFGFYAGIRVLSATPIFNRATGDIERWRHWLLFAEMSILDRFGCGHPVHFFECDVQKQEGHQVALREVKGVYSILVNRNDPHSLDERQASIYAAWDETVMEAGGVGALREILDRAAAEVTDELIATGEMKP